MEFLTKPFSWKSSTFDGKLESFDWKEIRSSSDNFYDCNEIIMM